MNIEEKNKAAAAEAAAKKVNAEKTEPKKISATEQADDLIQDQTTTREQLAFNANPTA